MILCVMRIPPDQNGHGASQRAWFLLNALCQLGPVHFVLVCHRNDQGASTTSLTSIESMVESVTKIDIPDIEPTRRRHIGPLEGGWIDVAKMRSQEAPRISAGGLQRIADQLPIRAADIVFAGRLPSAAIVQALIDKGLLSAKYRFVDFDDLMSKFKGRQLQAESKNLARQGRMLLRFEAAYLRAAETKITRTWDGASVCTDEDMKTLRAIHSSADVHKIPNVIERDQLPSPAPSDKVRLLFVGNLAFPPNVQGFQAFVEQSWPAIRAALPDVELTVVGLNPAPQVLRLVEEYGLDLHQNVPTVMPFYEAADMVIVPILMGSGTRIKILEAMAYGRAIVSTALGAEGLGLEDGRHARIVDGMAGFANAVIDLANDRPARNRMVAAARDFQQENYGPGAMNKAVEAALFMAAERSKA
jgi:glycosyltransferase involved in cell wall biosynthesis